ncbi:DUF2142 domain-containing protein, partial [Acidiphilium sp.]|uniref:DUF2142 domain-containing protein n=1 Tax=Acidiphilium sp. TaxID=527 RepID=UPI003D08678F
MIGLGGSRARGGWLRCVPPMRWLAWWFLVCAAPTGIELAMVTPIGQVADEPAHIARAAGLLDGQILGHRRWVAEAGREVALSGVMVNRAIIAASLAELAPGVPRVLSARRLARARSIQWSRGRGYDFCPNTVQYFPVFYGPGAFGIALSRAFGATPLESLYSGRLAMLASYLALGFTALLLAAWGRGVLFVVLCLPMALSLGASFNQDGQIIAATALVGALLTRAESGRSIWRHLALGLFALILCAKPPYGLLLFVAATPVAAPGFSRRLVSVAWYGLPALVWVIVMVLVSMVPYGRAPYHPGPLWPGDPRIWLHGTDAIDNLRVLVAHPLAVLELPVRFLIDHGRAIVASAVGVLGWLSIPLPRWEYVAWPVALIASTAGAVAGGQERSLLVADGLFRLGLIGVSVLAMELSLYLSWTAVGATEIAGPSGRYFLLFLPFLLLVLPRWGGGW